jgi:hypothetical protein
MSTFYMQCLLVIAKFSGEFDESKELSANTAVCYVFVMCTVMVLISGCLYVARIFSGMSPFFKT